MTANSCRTENQIIKRGTAFLCQIIAKDDQGEPLDMSTGFTCAMQVRALYPDGTVILTADSEADPATIVLTEGMIEILVNVPDDAPIGVHYYDIILSAPDGDFPVGGGTFTIEPRVTIPA